ncbi:MAG TPA: hypothetical protein VKR31_05960 [Rhizomicrobium sp.]|nr:hypothetical protein [Rhizomicrobium sp.]
MKLRHAALAALLATTSSLLVAQTAAAAEPKFTVLQPHGWTHNPGKHFPTALTTWNGTISYSGHNYNFTMVGTDPASSNTTTTVTTYLVPVSMTYTKAVYGSAHHKFNPTVDTQNGVTIMQNILNSPLFNNVDWNWGGTDVGTTQYNDGFQRASFWSEVTTNSSYHVLLSPSVLPILKLKPSKAQGGAVITNPIGGGEKIGEMNINSFDSAIQSYIRSHSGTITPNTFVLFVTDNIYLTSGGCCIGGYHSATNTGQTYGTATYAYGSSLTFSNDISAFSHEIGEWVADPLITSNSPCGLLEVGDPLEGKANFGTFPVTFGGVTWHPQALAMMEYFGDPANFSMNNWLDNQHIETSVCQNGG